MKKVKVYMKSGNLVKFNADEINLKQNREGKVKELSWRDSASTKYGSLLNIDIDNIEAVVIDFVGVK